MKKSLLFLIFTCIVATGFGQLTPSITYPNSVDLYGLCEISFRIPTIYSNPYNPDTINIYAVFTAPDNSSYTVNAFYYEDYSFQQHIDGHEIATHNPTNDGWRIRFTPNSVGTWTFMIKAFDKNGEINWPILNVNYTFTCIAVKRADGFISTANSRFLKRDVVINQQNQCHSFFPIGPNVAWYNCTSYCSINEPIGIYSYEHHIDSLYNRANYMRVWINRYQYLSLYGPEYTILENNQPKVYFDSIINQKDAAELDHIITYAKQHNISIMLSIFTHGDFLTNNDNCNPSEWGNNPFHIILNLSCPCEFFTNTEAKKITKNLIRYIVSRWGYATNIMCWELWNEVDHATNLCPTYNELDSLILNWHSEMAKYIRNNDPFGHIITSSVGSAKGHPAFDIFFDSLDIVQQHTYENIQLAQSRFELPYSIFIRANHAHNIASYQSKPFFMGEFGFSHSDHPHQTNEKDPQGVALHNSLWSSLFSASIGPASLWWWDYLDSCAMYKRFTPLKNFCQTLPVLSGSFSAHTTGTKDDENEIIVFDNGLATYYMINADEDTIMGWCQDTAFAYQSLRRLTDSIILRYDTLTHTIVERAYFADNVPPLDPNGYLYTLDSLKRPAPCSNSNTITLPITNQPVGATYKLRWYDTETGSPFNIIMNIAVQQNLQGNKFISFQIPSIIRNINKHTINNTFGDGAFIIVRNNQGPSPE